MFAPRHSDIWGGSAIVTFASAVMAHMHDINEVLQAVAFLVTITLGVISIVARVRANHKDPQ